METPNTQTQTYTLTQAITLSALAFGMGIFFTLAYVAFKKVK